MQLNNPLLLLVPALTIVLIYYKEIHRLGIFWSTISKVYQAKIKEEQLEKSENNSTSFVCEHKYGKVTIVTMLKRETASNYKEAQDSLRCYATARGYDLVVLDPFKDPESPVECNEYKQFLFRRHCVVSQLLKRNDWLVLLDADTGVINPNHCIEEYIKPEVDLYFYRRFFSGEIAAANYIARSSNFSIRFLREWADYEKKLPKASWHNLDNGAIHIHLFRHLFPNDTQRAVKCDALWRKAVYRAFCITEYVLDDYDRYVYCTTEKMNNTIRFGKISVFQRGKAWTRDGFPTKKLFSHRDFMFHDMKLRNAPHFKSKIDPTSCAKHKGKRFDFPTLDSTMIENETAIRNIIIKADRESRIKRPISLPGSSSDIKDLF